MPGTAVRECPWGGLRPRHRCAASRVHCRGMNDRSWAVGRTTQPGRSHDADLHRHSQKRRRAGEDCGVAYRINTRVLYRRASPPTVARRPPLPHLAGAPSSCHWRAGLAARVRARGLHVAPVCGLDVFRLIHHVGAIHRETLHQHHVGRRGVCAHPRPSRALRGDVPSSRSKRDCCDNTQRPPQRSTRLQRPGTGSGGWSRAYGWRRAVGMDGTPLGI